MKKLLLSCLLLFTVTASFSQIGGFNSDPKYRTSKLGSGGFFTLTRYYSSQDTSDDSINQHEYSLTFTSVKNLYLSIIHIKTIYFKANRFEVLQLYSAMNSVFLDGNKDNKDYNISFTLGKEDIIVRRIKPVFSKSQGGFFTSDESSGYTKGELDKLFFYIIPPVQQD